MTVYIRRFLYVCQNEKAIFVLPERGSHIVFFCTVFLYCRSFYCFACGVCITALTPPCNLFVSLYVIIFVRHRNAHENKPTLPKLFTDLFWASVCQCFAMGVACSKCKGSCLPTTGAPINIAARYKVDVAIPKSPDVLYSSLYGSEYDKDGTPGGDSPRSQSLDPVYIWRSEFWWTLFYVIGSQNIQPIAI